jgi:hemerythrin-like domain-containing protein
MPIQIGARQDHGTDQPLGLLSDCHRRIEYFLGVLVTIARQRGGEVLTAGEREQMRTALRYFAEAAPRHTADEEESLFPRLRAVDDPAARHALDTLARLETDHDEAERRHRAVDALAERWMAEERLDAAAVTALQGHLDVLQQLYAAHIKVEDHEVFPAAARLLRPEALADVGREMAARRRG